ncbi:MAG: hypothetical protein BYD32DRAFT_35719 [Podila humilis]|nr:MAG: hypothetical protein BYD32DRAFT_35719 [Podila humilis]
MLHSDNASVHGSMWETCMPPIFIETFKSRPLSSWPLLANSSLPNQLTGDVTIVGCNELQPKLAASHRNLTTQQFMKVHVENDSKQGNQDILPFYFPAPHVSGPDIVFYVRINEKIYPCFVQLKLQQVLEGSDVEKRFQPSAATPCKRKWKRSKRRWITSNRRCKRNRGSNKNNCNGIRQQVSSPINSNHHDCRTTARREHILVW